MCTVHTFRWPLKTPSYKHRVITFLFSSIKQPDHFMSFGGLPLLKHLAPKWFSRTSESKHFTNTHLERTHNENVIEKGNKQDKPQSAGRYLCAAVELLAAKAAVTSNARKSRSRFFPNSACR